MIEKLEDLRIWFNARQLNIEISEIIKRKSFGDHSLKDQMNRSSGSIMDNIAEGYRRNGKKEFIQFLSCSKGSCSELKSQLARAFDKNYIDKNEYDVMFDKTDHLEKMIAKFMIGLKNSKSDGWKYQK